MVRRGVEHIPVKEIINLAESEELEKTFRPRRWVDMRKHGWYSGDGHVHAQILTDKEASNIMTWIKAEDIHVANIVKMGDIFRTYFQQRGFGPNFRVTDKDFVLVPSDIQMESPQDSCRRVSGSREDLLSPPRRYNISF